MDMSRHLEPPSTSNNSHNTQFTFEDGRRSIDFILAYKGNSKLEQYVKRKDFESNLKEKGLELEEDGSVEGLGLRFVKIHAPEDVCREYCEKLKLRMRTKNFEKSECNPGRWYGAVRRYVSRMFDYDRQLFAHIRQYQTAVYSRDREHLFDVHAADFFTPTIRATIVKFILDRTPFSTDNAECYDFGIEKGYCAAYPLHQGYCDIRGIGSPRYALARGWGSFRNIFRYQPLDHVKEYFGAEIALYFTWLGFYTYMLLFPALLGLTCSLYLWSSSKDCPSWSMWFIGKWLHNRAVYSYIKEACDFFNFSSQEKTSDLLQYCVYCSYWEIKDVCLANGQPITRHLFEDWIAVSFTVLMCVWCAIFLERWKQYSLKITRKWGVTAFDKREEHPRPEYLARLRHRGCKRTVNPITNEVEPKMRFWTRSLPIRVLGVSSSMVLIYVSYLGVQISNVFSSWVNLFITDLYWFHHESELYRDDEGVDVPCDWTYDVKEKLLIISPAFMRSASTMVLNLVYTWLAKRSTNLSSHRTQNEYDDSLTRKLYVFNFVNYYASVNYIVFLQAKIFVGWPGNMLHRLLPSFVTIGHQDKVTTLQEICGLDNCLAELRVELAAVMISKQAINDVKEYIRPLIGCWWRGRNIPRAKKNTRRRRRDNLRPSSSKSEQWISDYKLLPFGPQALFPEYTEMVVQFGFVMLFAYAFPLAPLFALINNVLEVRLDAKKMVAFYRRPVPQPLVKHVNFWHEILDLIIYLAVFTNEVQIIFHVLTSMEESAGESFIIAFTSDIVPKMIYSVYSSKNHRYYNMSSYLEFSLSYANISGGDCINSEADECGKSLRKLSYCRENLNTDFAIWSKLDRGSTDFWICLTARLLFMVIFQNLLAILVNVVRRCVRSRDTPYETRGREIPSNVNRSNKAEHRKRRIIIETRV